MHVKRLTQYPLIDYRTAGYDETIHNNINGASLIRVPEWVPNPLGNYYLYFAHHHHDHIRMAYTDDLMGKWTILSGGVLNLNESRFIDHVASPDVHIDHEAQLIRMYYHGIVTPTEQAQSVPEIQERFFVEQRTRVALSSDGLHFSEQPEILSSAYLRVFKHQGWFYGVTMPGLLYRSQDGLTNFEVCKLLFGDDNQREAFFYAEGQVNPRHFAVQVVTETHIRLFFSLVPDTPESIYYSDVDTANPDWQTWQPRDPIRLLQPETKDEGVDLPLEESKRGLAVERVRQLRDPAIFTEAGHTYLLYSIAGEKGIGMVELLD